MTERERWWATATVWMEARGEPARGQLLIALSILGRVRDLRYPDTVGEVVLQPRQYSCWNTTSPTRAALARVVEAESPSWHSAAAAVATAETALPGVARAQLALHYYNPALAQPAWDDGTLPREVVGQHVFVRGVP